MESAPVSTVKLPWSLHISGIWPTNCTPTLESVSVDKKDIHVSARNHKDLCLPKPTPFQFILNPAAIAGQALLDAGIYRVSFYTANGSSAALSLQGFALIDAESTSATSPVMPESGFWWPQKEVTDSKNTNSGIGLNFELQGNTLAISTLSYTTAGNPIWYFGSGKLDDRIAHIPLLQLHGGPALFGQNNILDLPQSDTAAMADVEFHSNSQATVWFTRRTKINGESLLERKKVALSRLSFANEPDGIVWQGEWIFVPDQLDRSPLRLHLTNLLSQNEQEFILIDNKSGYSFKCRRNNQLPQSSPEVCYLYDVDGNNVAEFRTVAISHLEGFAADHSRVQMVRLSR